MHDNRWEGEKEEDKEKEDRVKREKPKKKKKEGEEEEEGEKVADKAKPPTMPKVQSQTFAVCGTIFVSKSFAESNYFMKICHFRRTTMSKTGRMTKTNGRTPATLKRTETGATQIPTPGATRRKTRGRKKRSRAKATPACRRRPDPAPRRRGAPKSSGPPGPRSTSPRRQPLRSPRRAASPSAPSPCWKATAPSPTGARRWRCCRRGAAWEARAR